MSWEDTLSVMGTMDAIRAQLGGVDPNRIMQARSATGLNYVVTYDQDGRPIAVHDDPLTSPIGHPYVVTSAIPGTAAAPATCASSSRTRTPGK